MGALAKTGRAGSISTVLVLSFLLAGRFAFAADGPAAYDGRYAIIVGVDDYLSSEINDLRFAQSDARSLAQTLVDYDVFDPSHITLLVGNDANYENIQKALKGLEDRSLYPTPDTLVFYFSGHGTCLDKENYILPVDGTSDPALSSTRNVSLTSIEDALGTSGFRREVVLLDACRDSLTRNKGVADNGFSPVQVRQDYADGMRIIFGTKFGQVSREMPSLGHGLFTYYLTQGLQGNAADKDNLITLSSLEAYVFDKMAGYSRQNPALEQIPTTAGEGSGQMVLAMWSPGYEPHRDSPSLLAANYSVKPLQVQCTQELVPAQSGVPGAHDLRVTMPLDRGGPKLRNYRLFVRATKRLQRGGQVDANWRYDINLLIDLQNRSTPYFIEINDSSDPAKALGFVAPQVTWAVDLDEYTCQFRVPLDTDTVKLNYAMAYYGAPSGEEPPG